MKGLILSLLLVSSTPVYAQEAGIVIAIRGTVNTQNSFLNQGDKIHVGDAITTTSNSFAVLQFTDGSKLTVRPSSVVVVDEYSYDTGEDKAQFSVVEGGLRIVTGAMAKNNPNDYLVKTPVALMGVRGTEFSILLVD